MSHSNFTNSGQKRQNNNQYNLWTSLYRLNYDEFNDTSRFDDYRFNSNEARNFGAVMSNITNPNLPNSGINTNQIAVSQHVSVNNHVIGQNSATNSQSTQVLIMKWP